MSNTYKDLLIFSLSNIAEWKSEVEMIIPEEMRKDFYGADTCEFLGDRKYILRLYWENGNKRWEIGCKNEYAHGRYIRWCKKGYKSWETEYLNGKLAAERVSNFSS